MADSESTLSGFYEDELMGMTTEPVSDERDRNISDIDISEYLTDDMFFGYISRVPSTPVSNVSGHDQALKVIGVDEESRADHEECAVCLEKLFDEERKDQAVVVKETPCGHRFHDKCIEQWLSMRSSCPLCRYEMPQENHEDDEEAVIRQQIIEARQDVRILQHLLMNF